MQSTKVLVILSICFSVVYSKSLHKKSEEDCPQYCPELFQPVCASDGDTTRSFANACLLKAYNCWDAKKGFEVRSYGLCEGDPLFEIPKETADCPPCTKIYLPVCGVDDDGQTRTFANECEVDFINCDERRNYKMLRDGEC